ncbi:MAG: chorismate-binding protein, partial [bacterium]|nr:chorismate-binding protein [bacterium]
DRCIKVRPMKGTIERGKNKRQDMKNENDLKNSIKNRAENLMIVDMMRNDLGRICRFGSVITNPLFQIEKYKTLFQMTSTISGELRQNIKLVDIFKALFPSSSITGAPKIRTMQIINELEKSPRKLYTGTIGIVKPDNSSVFNVAIRTIIINGKSGEMGTGGGIVYDSKPEKEYDECLLKAAFLASACKKMQLIETIRWSSNEGFYLLDLHLERLRRSAEFFKFIFNRRKIIRTLEKFVLTLNCEKTYRIRVLLFQEGNISISYQEINLQLPDNQKTFLSNKRIDPRNIFLYHKSTIRDDYDKAYREAAKNGYFDVIFKNKNNQITEGCITNIFVEKNGILYTPPVSCGLLPGVLRNYLLQKGMVKEKILTEDDLHAADNIFLGNSVRGLIKDVLENS